MSLVKSPYASMARECWRCRLALRRRRHDLAGQVLTDDIAIRHLKAAALAHTVPEPLRRACLTDLAVLAPLALRPRPGAA